MTDLRSLARARVSPPASHSAVTSRQFAFTSASVRHGIARRRTRAGVDSGLVRATLERDRHLPRDEPRDAVGGWSRAALDLAQAVLHVQDVRMGLAKIGAPDRQGALE